MSLVDFYQCFFSQGICDRKRLKKGSYGQLAGKRMSFLNALLDHRKSLGFPMGMMRDLFCFIAYNSCIHEMNHEQALTEVYTLNDSFPNPLTKKEMIVKLIVAQLPDSDLKLQEGLRKPAARFVS